MPRGHNDMLEPGPGRGAWQGRGSRVWVENSSKFRCMMDRSRPLYAGFVRRGYGCPVGKIALAKTL